jgi:ubiquitin carboxyl-terminal hydrolase 34
VCSECGKVKNRLEDFYNLSLTVKDIKGVHESLAQLVEGETISGYECSGCKKKVDVSKRTLIAETPNVLIVHLQRIVFNFDTFANDKLNQHFEFPQQLDLAPYSYYDVMGKENRLKKPAEGGEAQEEEIDAEASAEKKDEDNEEEENVEPEQEDCFEYKLAGVTVHSGTAHAGHYWAYINTARGQDAAPEGADEATWSSTDNDRWMEFNDSTVRDF